MEFHKDIQREIDRVPAHIEKVKSMQAFVIIADELEAAFDTYHHRYVDVNSYSVTVSFMFKTMDEAKARSGFTRAIRALTGCSLGLWSLGTFTTRNPGAGSSRWEKRRSRFLKWSATTARPRTH